MNTQQGSRAQAAAPGKPGQMTMAMRAMPQSTGPKVLRIGKVQGGRVIEERVVKQRTHVTMGSSHTNLFLAAGPGVPETMKLFELVGSDYVLNLTDAMTGRVALPAGITDVAQARASGTAKRVGNFYQLKLTDDSRGKVVVGETTFLFQFVAPPPIQPKAQLPLAVKGGMASQIDWGFTIIAAFSFLLHFGFAVAANGELFDPVVDEEAETAALIQQAKDRPVPPVEDKKPDDKADKDKKDDKDKKADKDPAKDKVAAAAKKPDAAGAAGAGASKPASGGLSAGTAKALSNELDELELKALGSLGAGPATASIMKPGSSAAESALDDVSKRAGGVGTGDDRLKTGPGGGAPTIGPGGGKDISKIGETGGGPPGGASTGKVGDKSDTVKAPTGDASTGAAAGAGNVKDADSVIARNRFKFKSCYNKALATDPSAGGTVKVAVKIGEGGEVTSASVASSDAPAGLTSCIVAAFNSMKFSEPDGGSASFTVPVVLSARK